MIGFQFGWNKYRGRSLCRRGWEIAIMKYLAGGEENFHNGKHKGDKWFLLKFRILNKLDIWRQDLDWNINQTFFFWKKTEPIII